MGRLRCGEALALAWEAWVRAIHLLAAAIWYGGGLFAILMVMPTARAAGPPGKAFMMTVLKRGGFGKVFGPAGGITVLAGLVLYWGRGYHSAPFTTTGNALLTVGAILGILTFAEGLAVAMPNEMKMRKIVAAVGPQGPNPEQGAELEKLAMKQGKAGMRSVILLTLAFLLMLTRGLIA